MTPLVSFEPTVIAVADAVFDANVRRIIEKRTLVEIFVPGPQVAKRFPLFHFFSFSGIAREDAIARIVSVGIEHDASDDRRRKLFAILVFVCARAAVGTERATRKRTRHTNLSQHVTALVNDGDVRSSPKEFLKLDAL